MMTKSDPMLAGKQSTSPQDVGNERKRESYPARSEAANLEDQEPPRGRSHHAFHRQTRC